MTLPNERTRSLRHARAFLRGLLDPKKTPRIPRKIRKEAYWALRHYPSDYEIDKLVKALPEVLGEDSTKGK